MAKMGRPVFWDEDKKEFAIDSILERIAAGESCRAILDKGDRSVYPSFVTFCEWLKNDGELAKQYVRASDARSDKIFEDILEIADNSGNDSIEVDGLMIVNHEAIQRDKLRIEARKWMLSKMVPKKYGDKIEVDANIKGEIKTVTIFKLPDNGR